MWPAPLLHNGQLLGTLVLATRRPARTFSEEDGRDLEILGAYAASRLLAVERAQLFAVEATARELTHLINNDLALVVAPLDLMRDDTLVRSQQRAMLDNALVQISVATARLTQLSRLVRFRTKQTPAGTSLDLGASARGLTPTNSPAPALIGGGESGGEGGGERGRDGASGPPRS